MIPAAPVCTTFAEAAFVEVAEEAPLFVAEPLFLTTSIVIMNYNDATYPVVPADLVGEPAAGEEPAAVVPLAPVVPAAVVLPAVVPPAPPVGGGAAVPPEPEGVWPRQLESPKNCSIRIGAPVSEFIIYIPESMTVTVAVWAMAPTLSRRLKPIWVSEIINKENFHNIERANTH
jgi:hypothetical protein